MTKPEKILYTAHASATGGREGQARPGQESLAIQRVAGTADNIIQTTLSAP